MAAENPMKEAKDFFNQQDHDRLIKEGVTKFADLSSLPVPDDPDAVSSTTASTGPKSSHSSPSTPPPFANPNVSTQRGGISRRDFFWGGIVLGAAAIGGLAYVSRNEQAITGVTIAAKPTSEPIQPTRVPTTAAISTARRPVEEAKPIQQAPVRIPSPEPTTTIEPTKIPISPEVIAEQQAWKKVLGADVEVKPFPSYITPEVKSKLDFYGLKLMYLPKLELGSLDELQKKGTSRYLDDLQTRYPNWRHFERMSPAEKSNHDIPRNLEEEGFWLPIIDGKIEFPKLPGQWVAVEKLRKPNQGQFYEITELSKYLGDTNRRRANRQLDSHHLFRYRNYDEDFLIGKIGLRKGDKMRLPETFEWNLMANREGWGSTNTWEWTSTHFRDFQYEPSRVFLVIGNSDRGGTAIVERYLDITGPKEGDGFRLAVFLAP